MHDWGHHHIESLLADPRLQVAYGNSVVLVATDGVLGHRDRCEFPRALTLWAEEEGVSFSRAGLSQARRDLAVLALPSGIPFVYFAPHEIRVAVYDAGRLGPWLWSYSER